VRLVPDPVSVGSPAWGSCSVLLPDTISSDHVGSCRVLLREWNGFNAVSGAFSVVRKLGSRLGPSRTAKPAGFGLGASRQPGGVFMRYRLPSRTYVELRISTLAGRRLVSLSQGLRPAGENAALLDCAGVVSGVWILELRTPLGFARCVAIL